MQTSDGPLQERSLSLHAVPVSTRRRTEVSDIHEQNNFGGGNFAEYIGRERNRLQAEREQIFSQQEELQRKLDALNREFAAIDAYETAKTGKVARPASAGQQP